MGSLELAISIGRDIERIERELSDALDRLLAELKRIGPQRKKELPTQSLLALRANQFTVWPCCELPALLDRPIHPIAGGVAVPTARFGPCFSAKPAPTERRHPVDAAAGGDWR